MTLRHREGEVANAVGLCLQRERHTKCMQDFLCTGIADLQHGLALLSRFGEVTQSGGQHGMVSLSQITGKMDLRHKVLACHNRIVQLGGKHVLSVGQSQQMPAGKSLRQCESDAYIALLVCPQIGTEKRQFGMVCPHLGRGSAVFFHSCHCRSGIGHGILRNLFFWNSLRRH